MLAYQFDAHDAAKQARAREVVRSPHVFVVSTQVMLELFVGLTRHLEPPLPHEAASRVIRRVAS